MHPIFSPILFKNKKKSFSSSEHPVRTPTLLLQRKQKNKWTMEKTMEKAMEMKLNMNFVNFESTGFPLVEATLHTRKGDYQGYFVVDTGSTDNLVSFSMREFLNLDNLADDVHQTIQGLGDLKDCDNYNLSFNIGECSFMERFAFHKDFDITHYILNGEQVMGILGSGFLKKHNLVMDYSTLSLHSPVREDVPSAEECQFRFPLDYGLDRLGISLLGIAKDKDNCFLMVADSGCNHSTITQHCIESSGFKSSEVTDYYMVQGVDRSGNLAEMKEVSIGLITMDANDDTAIIDHEMKFLVVSKQDYLCVIEEDAPIAGLLGNDFLYHNKVILDYNLRCIYSRKGA